MRDIELYQNKSNYLDKYTVVPQNHLLNQTQTTLQPAGIGNLLLSAMPVIILMLKLKNTPTPSDVEQIYQTSINKIQAFEKSLQQIGYAPKIILAACYCLCTAFDEMILNTSWGEQSPWINNTLLSSIHKETWGGERFYIILNNMAEDPINNLDILELIYVLLDLGFEGKYFHQNKDIRNEIRHSLFNLIRNYRESPKINLSPTPVDKRTITYHTQKRLPMQHFIITTIVLLFLIMLGLNFVMYFKASPLLNALCSANNTGNIVRFK